MSAASRSDSMPGGGQVTSGRDVVDVRAVRKARRIDSDLSAWDIALNKAKKAQLIEAAERRAQLIRVLVAPGYCE